MSDRITARDLEAVCQRINRMVNGAEVDPWTRDESRVPKTRANVDAYYIDGAYGGVSLFRMVNESGGVSDVFGCGHMPKRELYDRMQAFLRGLEVRWLEDRRDCRGVS